MTRNISIGLVVLVICGCSSPPAPTAPERLMLRHVAILYGKYLGSHQGRPPKDEVQFKKYIKELKPNELAAAGVSANDVDAIFVSPRDGQPYDVRYNNPPPADGPAIVVAERTGKDGKRMVGYTTGKTEELDDAEYQKIRFTGN